MWKIVRFIGIIVLALTTIGISLAAAFMPNVKWLFIATWVIFGIFLICDVFIPIIALNIVGILFAILTIGIPMVGAWAIAKFTFVSELSAVFFGIAGVGFVNSVVQIIMAIIDKVKKE